MKAPSYNVGMFVEHPSRPQWGPGKVMAVTGERIYVVFRNEMERKAKAILREVVQLTVAVDQTDAVLDLLPSAVQEDGDWILPKNYERFLDPNRKVPGSSGPRAPRAKRVESAAGRARRGTP